ncbi:MAG: ABC transporter substrate-binding protein, partial [Rhizobiales bacterium]|nr:ABC transporter substrate-binding protein [Hyphomicrobiales bacterium]
DAWAKLSAEQQKVLQDAAAFMEGLCDEDMKVNETEKKRQADAGIETISFEGAEGEAYIKQAYEAGWAEFIKANPETGPKLKELLSK